jgi:hypothetical protein
MQQGLAVRRKFHEYFAMILVPVSALQSALNNETIYKFHRAVMAKAELLGECGNSGTSALGQALDREEKLMLLGFDTLGAGRFLAKVQELPNTVPELSKPTKACS